MEGAMDDVKYSGISEWFTGKSAIGAQQACDAINRSIAGRGWEKGASRRCHAAMNKLCGTKQLARAARAIQELTQYYHEDHPSINEPGSVKGLRDAWFRVYMALTFGSRLDRAELDIIKANLKPGQSVEVGDQRVSVVDYADVYGAAERFQAGMAPIWAAMDWLDELRPAPKFDIGDLSPTVSSTLRAFKLKPETFRLPKFKYIEVKNRDGVVIGYTVEIIWPEGTVHNRAKLYAHVTRSGNLQCNACGHAIKDNMNWVPVVADDVAGVPHSMWLGRDCARKLFNVTVTGDAVYKNGPAGALTDTKQ